MAVTGDGELEFDSGEGAWETATTSKEGSRRANYPIPTRGAPERKDSLISLEGAGGVIQVTSSNPWSASFMVKTTTVSDRLRSPNFRSWSMKTPLRNAFAEVGLSWIQEFHLWPWNTNHPDCSYWSLPGTLNQRNSARKSGEGEEEKFFRPLPTRASPSKSYSIIPCWIIQGI